MSINGQLIRMAGDTGIVRGGTSKGIARRVTKNMDNPGYISGFR